MAVKSSHRAVIMATAMASALLHGVAPSAAAWSFSHVPPSHRGAVLSRPKWTTATATAGPHHRGGGISSSYYTTTTSSSPPRRGGGVRSSSSFFPILSNAASATATADDDDVDDGGGDGDGRDPPLFEPFLAGILRDYRMRLPLYKSDVTDGLNVQCLAATLFLFFACLAPAVGFGALFGSVTNGAIGTMEMVSSTAACGVIYALASAQPMTIIGSTGPVLAFVATLVKLAEKLNLPFLPLYAWTGMWTSAILLVSSVTSASHWVKYLTRFTDEIFSTLISFIFVVEAVQNIARSFTNPASSFAKGLLTLVVASTTYAAATILRGLRNTVYFNKRVRKNLSNFGPTLGVVAGALVANWAELSQGAAAALPALVIPPTFATTSGRPWLIPLFDLPVWARWAAFLPAIMATVLLFLDQNITVRLVNNPQYKMVKGRRKNSMLDGMHADMLVISILTFLSSLVGLPWLVAATVRSISHVRALSVFDSTTGRLKRTIEQRMTGVTIHGLIGACVLFDAPRAVLTRIPKPVLMGLFLFLGTSSLPGNEMWERIKGIFKDSKRASEERWSAVPRRTTNLFTAIQIVCLGAMVYVKESPIGVLFPVVIALMAPLRFALEKTGVVKKEYMDILDED